MITGTATITFEELQEEIHTASVNASSKSWQLCRELVELQEAKTLKAEYKAFKLARALRTVMLMMSKEELNEAFKKYHSIPDGKEFSWIDQETLRMFKKINRAIR